MSGEIIGTWKTILLGEQGWKNRIPDFILQKSFTPYLLTILFPENYFDKLPDIS